MRKDGFVIVRMVARRIKGEEGNFIHEFKQA